MEMLFKGGTIFPITKKPFKGDLLVKDGKIHRMAKSIKKTKNCEVVDVSGKYLFPGFIDAHCHIGLYPDGLGDTESEGNEMTEPITADLMALDAF
ncbi:MAG: amidohydrolase, partial [Thermotogae bacterium]